MANDLNAVALIGRLTHDAEMKFTSGGMAILKFSLAVNKRKKIGDQWEDEAQFFECTYFGKGAEAIEAWMTKGKQVAVTGSLAQSRWEQDGQNRSKVGVVANSVQLLSSPGDSKQGGSAPPRQPQAPRSAPSTQYGQRAPQAPQDNQHNMEQQGPEQFLDDQIPF